MLATVDDAIVGYAWVQDYGPHIRGGQRLARFHDLRVAEAFRLRGIGRRLFATARDWAHAHGVLWLQWQSSPHAVGFYERLGLRGEPCPQPDYPEFEIEFSDNASDARMTPTQNRPPSGPTG